MFEWVSQATASEVRWLSFRAPSNASAAWGLLSSAKLSHARSDAFGVSIENPRRVIVEDAAEFGGIAQPGEVGGDKILAAIGARQRLPGAGLGVGAAAEADQPFHAFARAPRLVGDLGIGVGPARRRRQSVGAADQRGARLVAKRRGGVEVQGSQFAEREFVALKHRLGVG